MLFPATWMDLEIIILFFFFKDFIIRMNKRYKYNRMYKLNFLIILVSRVSKKRSVAYEDRMLSNKLQHLRQCLRQSYQGHSLDDEIW